MQLIVTLMEQSARDLQSTNERIQEYWKDAALRLARGIMSYEYVIDTGVMDRETMDRFCRESQDIAWFAELLLKNEEKSPI